MPQAPSTRWCPTPEQLMILEEMYRSGVRTPNAPQIQQITAHLSYYGKIEGKNVFYWFQNHKARDRQKLRRRLSRHHHLLHHLHHHSHPLPFHSSDDAPQQHHQNPPHFLHQAHIRGGTEGKSLPRKTESCRREGSPATNSPAYGYEYEWTVMVVPPCCRPLKTLDLFPIRSTGLKDQCSTSTD